MFQRKYGFDILAAQRKKTLMFYGFGTKKAQGTDPGAFVREMFFLCYA